MNYELTYEYDNHLYIPCLKGADKFWISGSGYLCCKEPEVHVVCDEDLQQSYSSDQIKKFEILGKVHIIDHISIPNGYYVKIKMEK